MKTLNKNLLRSQSGFTILEVLIAALITSILAASAFQFFTKMSGQTDAQYQLSDSQLLVRNSVLEVKKSMRMAGFKLAGHAPYDFSGDTVMIFMQITNPVDTVKYYLEEYFVGDYAAMPNLPDSVEVYRLMKRINSDSAAVYSDFITDFTVTAIGVGDAVVEVSAITAMPDFDMQRDNGYRTFTLSERVHMRNVI
jgi:prepilin-type N-terminal cleavage/methylation domain-containing protein